jgi:hypothetical protein
MHESIPLSALFFLSAVALTGLSAMADPKLRFEQDAAAKRVTFLSWDTDGGDRVKTNLLRAPATGAVVRLADDDGEFEFTPSGDVTLPFDPRVTPTTVLSARWTDDGGFRLPAIINAPDFGPALLTAYKDDDAIGWIKGSRTAKTVDVILRTRSDLLRLTPMIEGCPAGVDNDLWDKARRGWFNGIQPCAQWGEQGRPFSAPTGILGNNVISDPASTSLWFYADQIFFLPEPAKDVSLLPLLRRTIDYWIDTRMKESGEIVGYWDYAGFLDANAGPIIASWDYIEAGGEPAWLAERIARLEKAADFLISRDVDDDGLIEATQSGNDNALQQPNRSCAWWDALNCGHKDGYTNAIIYRAFRCLGDLESKLGREEQRRRYADRADRLKAAYFKTLFNPQTGWLAWWKSADGKLHDYASPTLNGIAIEYGLVPAEEAKRILDRLWAKMEQVKFTRFDLGVPPMLVPVRRADYLQPEAIGMPHREDGTDTFGVYMNGGITAGQVLHFIAAHYAVGDMPRGDKILRAMLQRQSRGEFQNGVVDSAMHGIDWTTWDGKPSGYEGYLADSFRFLQAVLLRDPATRDRFYRPLR